MKWCNSCCQHVSPVRKKFSWVLFLLFCITGIGGIIYIIYHLCKSKNKCPMCGCKVISKSKHEKQVNKDNQIEIIE